MTYEYGFHAFNTLILICCWITISFMFMHWAFTQCIQQCSSMVDKFENLTSQSNSASCTDFDTKSDPYLGSHKIHKE